MKIEIAIEVKEDGTVVTSSSVDFMDRKQDLNASVIAIGALEVTKNAILQSRFMSVDDRKEKP